MILVIQMEARLNNKKFKKLIARMLFSWRSIPLGKKLFILIGSMFLLIVLELFILSYAMTNLSAIRAFVGGGGMWSNGQKNAFYQFERYTLTKDENDYKEIFNSLKVSDGDSVARIELLKTKPDLDLVRKNFIQGKIHPLDISGLIYFFRRFQSNIYMNQAIGCWIKADKLIVEFKKIVAEYKESHLMGEMTAGKERAILEKVNSLNTQLTILEKQFSDILGEGSRWMEAKILMLLLSLVLTVSSFCLFLTLGTSKSITKNLTDLNKLAAEYGLGNFDRRLKIQGKDEIGMLTFSINKMGDLLSNSCRQILDSHQKLEKKVEERTAELKNALKIRDEFLSIANHELRTPLTAIVLQLRILERAIEKAKEDGDLNYALECSRKANRLIKKMVELQNALMDLTQIQLGKFEIRPENCDLAPIANDCISQLSLEALRSGAHINLSLSKPVNGNFDPVRSSQVITNLLGNAIKYGEGKPIEVDLRNKEGKAVITITDHGPGIPAEKMDKIFDRFERGDHNHSLSGLGLGLYITKQIVEAHGGQIYVSNVEGKGARFTAEFPA